MAQCKWQSESGVWHDCHLPAEFQIATHGDQCIFHAHASAKQPGEMQDALRRLMNEYFRNQKSILDFSGFRFVDGWSNIVFHNQNPSTALFVANRVRFVDAHLPKDNNFTRLYFSRDVDFTRCSFAGSVTFSNTSFHEKAVFDGIAVDGETNFFAARFEDDCTFISARLGSKADFSRSRSNGVAVFDDCNFGGETDFKKSTFKQGTFSRATFKQSVSFQEIRFDEAAVFEAVTFCGECDFYNGNFQVLADFTGSHFGAIAKFRSSKFTGEIRFSSTKFAGTLDCDSCHFNGLLRFDDSSFGRAFGSASFVGATFAGDASFVRVQFNMVFFNDAVFLGVCSFDNASFLLSANFFRAKFKTVWFRKSRFRLNSSFDHSEVDNLAVFTKAYFGAGLHSFSNATFHGHVFLNEAILFKSTLHFPNASFALYCQLHRTIICGKCRIVWPGIGKKFVLSSSGEGKAVFRGTLLLESLRFRKDGILDLRRNQLQDDSKLVLLNMRMANILLEGTDCSQVQLYNCEWPFLSEHVIGSLYKSNRDVVGDEYQFRELRNPEFDPSLTRQTYLQLAKRYRELLDYPRANEFDRGAFEMRRLSSMRKKDWQSSSNHRWLSLYRYASHYSGNLALPLFWLLIGVLVIFPLAFVGADQFHSLIPIGEEYFGWYIDFEYFCGVVVLSLQSAFSFGLSNHIQESLTNAAKVLQIVERIFAASMITLLIFALRRRFKH